MLLPLRGTTSGEICQDALFLIAPFKACFSFLNSHDCRAKISSICFKLRPKMQSFMAKRPIYTCKKQRHTAVAQSKYDKLLSLITIYYQYFVLVYVASSEFILYTLSQKSLENPVGSLLLCSPICLYIFCILNDVFDKG